jgi:hypothetical protein
MVSVLIDWRGENGRLIKNIYLGAQADSAKKKFECLTKDLEL